MELKKRYIILIIFFIFNISKAEMVKPSQNLSAYDVVKIQLDALRKNDDKNNGIMQTWLFAHPDNKKFTGPYEKFKSMILGKQYKFLLNHSSHKINLISNSTNTFIYRVEVIAVDKQLFFYEWHVQKGTENDCNNCWYTSAVSQPFDQGNTI